MSDLDALGRRLAELQDRHLADLRQAPSPCSPALGEHLLRRSHERRRGRRLAVAALAVLLLVAGGLAMLRLQPVPLRETVATVHAEAGQRVVAAVHDVALAFDDGSQVVLSSGASLRTDALGPVSASLSLERGQATVRVVPIRGTRYTVRAGSYIITVTGTHFRVDWRPERAALSLTVEEGSVLLGGGLLGEPLAVRGGQSVAFENGRAVGLGARQGTGQGSSGPRAEAEPATEPEESTPRLEPVPAVVAPSPLGRRPIARSPTPPSWQARAEAGNYREALSEVERVGYATVCREATAADLLTLAEAARYAGRSDRAEQALLALRARFAASEDAAMAAYILGRMAAEHRRDHAQAARWFRTYLAERSGGRLDREAEGRLLESLAFTDRNQARKAARAYLEHYPRGPHAAFARSLLGP